MNDDDKQATYPTGEEVDEDSDATVVMEDEDSDDTVVMKDDAELKKTCSGDETKRNVNRMGKKWVV